MDDEIGHVCVRLFKRGGSYQFGSVAYMGRKLNEEEARRLLALWNSLETFLRTLRPQSQTEEDE